VKTKISKFLGVGLALIMVFTLAFALVPAQEAEAAPAQWTPEVTPGLTGNVIANIDVTGMAVASDGMTIYVIDAQTAAPGQVLKSPNGGRTFSAVTNPTPAGQLPRLIAVAPDNPNVVAVVDDTAGVAGFADGRIFVTENGGVNWIELPQAPDMGVTPGNNVVLDIEVGPSRSTAALRRDYAVAVADDTAATDDGGLFIIGQTLAWTAVTSADEFTITGAAAGDAGNITIATGSVLATPAGGATVAGVGLAVVITGTTTWAAPAGGTIRIQALNNGTTGNIDAAGGPPSPDSLTTPVDFDVDIWINGAAAAFPFILTGGGAADTFTLPDGVIADFTNVEFTPGYLGDRVLVGVGSDASGTSLHLFNLGAAWGGPTAAYTPLPGGPVLLQVEPIDYAPAGGPTQIATSDIALPSNFDPTTPGGQKTFVALAANGNLAAAGAGCDVFRADFTTVRKLGIAADTRINSISYSGDLTGGLLIAGATALTTFNHIQTWFTVDPMAASPTWIGSSKAPTGMANAIVVCHPDFQNNGYIFAGSTSALNHESALSLSYDRGTSFNQISLIDTTISGMSDVMPTPAGDEVFLATFNNGAGADLESLWKSPIPATTGTWDRVRISPANWGNTVGDTIIRLNPGYTSFPVIYWANFNDVNIQYSNDGGAVFVARDSIPANITDIAVEDEETLYGACGTNIYRSDSAAWNFAVGPVDAGIGPINMIAMAPTYPLEPVAGNLLVGGGGAIATYSTNGAEAFAPPISTGLTAGTMQVVADTDYATNNTIYAGSGAAAGIFRWVIGTSSIWELISAAPAQTATTGLTSGMVATNGALYGGWTTATGGATGAAADAFTITQAIAGAGVAADEIQIGDTTQAGDTGTVTCNTGQISVTPVGNAGPTVNGAGAAVVLTPGGTANWTLQPADTVTFTDSGGGTDVVTLHFTAPSAPADFTATFSGAGGTYVITVPGPGGQATISYLGGAVVCTLTPNVDNVAVAQWVQTAVGPTVAVVATDADADMGGPATPIAAGAPWTVFDAALPATDYIQVQALVNNCNGTYLAGGAGTTQAAVVDPGDGDAWAITPATGGVDAFSLPDAAVGAGDNGNIIVTTGSVTVQGFGGATPLVATPVVAGGSQAWTTNGITQTVVVTSTTANTTGTWSQTTGATVANITSDADGDASVAAAGGGFNLPDIIVGAGAGAAVSSGADRTLDPTDAAGTITWDVMNVGAAASAFTATPQALRIDVTESPTLYAIDTAGAGGAGLLMSYNDLMATATTTLNTPAAGATIPIDPVTGRAMPVTLNWDAMGFATGLANIYHVLIYEESQGPAGGELFAVQLVGPAVNNPTYDIVPVGQAAAGDIAYTFVGGTSYGIMIRAADEVSTDAIISPFCAPVFIDIEASGGVITPTHAGPELTSPTPGSQDVDPGTGFSWNPMAGVTEYELIIATDSALTSPVAGTPILLDTTSYGPVDLEYATDYYYAVKATEPTSSVQSVGHFRTMDEPVEKYTCQYCGLTFDTRAELEAHIAAVHAPTTPLYIWIVIALGAILVIAVIWLIFTTRRA
jgi:hypothetical protein